MIYTKLNAKVFNLNDLYHFTLSEHSIFNTSNFKQILNNLGYNRIKRSYAIKVFDKLFDFQLRTYLIIIFVTV